MWWLFDGSNNDDIPTILDVLDGNVPQAKPQRIYNVETWVGRWLQTWGLRLHKWGCHVQAKANRRVDW